MKSTGGAPAPGQERVLANDRSAAACFAHWGACRTRQGLLAWKLKLNLSARREARRRCDPPRKRWSPRPGLHPRAEPRRRTGLGKDAALGKHDHLDALTRDLLGARSLPAVQAGDCSAAIPATSGSRLSLAGVSCRPDHFLAFSPSAWPAPLSHYVKQLPPADRAVELAHLGPLLLGEH